MAATVRIYKEPGAPVLLAASQGAGPTLMIVIVTTANDDEGRRYGRNCAILDE